MRAMRRLLQVVALVGTLLIGVTAVALIVSQTPWFRDWVRRYVVRESKQYLNGDLSIGQLGGNLFFGVNLTDVAVDLSGKRVVAVKGLEVDYNFLDFISKGIVLDEIKLIQPRVELERDGNGWNLGRLVKAQRREAKREGPARPVSLQSIEISDASVRIDDAVGTSGYRLPDRIDGLDVKAAFEYEPVHYTIDVAHVSFRGASPQFTLEELTGRIAVRDDNLYLEKVGIKSAESSFTVDGVVEQYLRTPNLQLTTTGTVSLPEIGRVVPAAAGYPLHPTFDVKANGPIDRLSLDVNLRSQAGNVRGQLTADVKAPDLAVKGQLDLERLNLAPIIKNPAQRSDLTGHLKVDLSMPSRPDAPLVERLHGSFAFAGPRAHAAGYQASDVRVTGTMAGRTITLDGRAAAYGGTGTARGEIVLPSGRNRLSFDLRGRAEDLDLRRLPATTRAPQVATNLSIAEYRIKGAAGSINGAATLNASEIEGATVADGTVAEFTSSNGKISYAARGSVSDLNLRRIGAAFKIAALDKEQYDSRINSSFEVRGAGTKTAELRLDASGSLTDSTALGATFPQLGFEAHLDRGALEVRADGGFENVDPSQVAANKRLAGTLTGTVNAGVRIADISAPITPASIAGDGRVELSSSTIGGMKIDTAVVEGRYASEVGDLTRINVSGPDLKLEAAGRLALDRDSSSALTYHVEGTHLAELARLAGQENIDGAAVIDGTVTGNAASMRIEGTLEGSGLKYQQNGALDLKSRYTVTVPELQFARATVQATTDATFVKIGAMEIGQLTATTTYADQKVEFETNLKEKERELDASGQVILHPDHQEIHLPDLVLRTQGVEWRTAPGTEAAVRYGNDRVELENVKLVSGDQTLDVSGAFAVRGDQPAGTIDVQADNLDLAQLERLALQNRGIGGRLTANAKISGTASAPLVKGHFEIMGGAFQTYRYDSLKADVDYQGTRIGVDATLQQSPTESVTARGSVPQSLFSRSEGGHVDPTAGDEVDLQVQTSALSLGFVQGFTTQVTNVTGTLQADVRVTGSGQDPHVEGFVDIKGGSFGVPAGGVTYTGLDTRIELTPDVVRIPNLQIQDEEGESMTISGELAVHARKVGEVNINVTSDNFELIDNELGDVGVDSQLKISGELRRPRIEGEVRVEAARLEVDRILALFYDPYAVEALPDVVSAERTVEGAASAEDATRQALSRAEGTAAAPGAETEEAGETGGAFAPVALDVRLRIPDNLVLRGRKIRAGGPTSAALGDMNITLGGDMNIRKDPDAPLLLLGTVETIRGTYDFQGRRFDLARGGTLRFIGERQINPILDVTASREIPNTGVEARVRITGTARTPQLQLTSNPPLEESDILALIVFNRPVNELGTGERASLAATAGGIATGFIAAPLGESIGRALDLDLFEITTTSDNGELGAGVTLGQQVGDRAFVKVRQQFGSQDATEFLIEYQLADFLRLQASAAPDTSGSANRVGQRRIERAGIDLIFFFSY